MKDQNEKKLYTTGEFAKKANVTLRTIRYYDTQGLLKPTAMSEAGYRLYTDEDFARLQKILTLKYLGFSLDEIADISLRDSDPDYIVKSLDLQKELIHKRMEGLRLVELSLDETKKQIESGENVDWSHMLKLIHMVNMENALAEQYKNGSNLNIRIGLHEKYSENKQGWFPWIYEQMDLKPGMKILEIGCGNGELWKTHHEVEKSCTIILSDVSEGMVQEAKNLAGTNSGFRFETMDCQEIPYLNETFDMVIANHVMFYVKNQDKALKEIARVLKKGGIFICSTYGEKHMKEISTLVKEFDQRIALSEVNLYDIFGLENGRDILKKYFSGVEIRKYDDRLKVDAAEPLIDYILSCHGNQNELLKEQYRQFKSFLEGKLAKKGYIEITKSAGMFYCRK